MSKSGPFKNETVLVAIDEGVAQITLNRPQQLNALSQELTSELLFALRTLEADDSVRAIVVTGAGRAFSAGMDFGGGDQTFAGPSDPDEQARNVPEQWAFWKFTTRN